MSETDPQLEYLASVLGPVCDILDEASIPYAVVGGIALSVWAEARTTYDVDLMLGVSADQIDSIRDLMQARGEFLFDPQLTPMASVDIVRLHVSDPRYDPPEITTIDLLVFEREFSEPIVQRRESVEFAGRNFWFCSPEDLVLLKMKAGRRQDLADIIRILDWRHDVLDLDYLDNRTEALGQREEWHQLIDDWKRESRDSPPPFRP